MNQSIKSIVALVVLVTLAASILGWTTRGIEGVPEAQFWMRLAPIICLPALAFLIWVDFRRDRAPDFLKLTVGSYFERHGLCFSIAPSTANGVFYWVVFFQNRYDRRCHASIGLRPAKGNFGILRPRLPEIHIDVECEGAAFGAKLVPYPVSPDYLGKKLTFELAAQTAFPEGRGTLVRFRDGKGVGSRNKSGLDTAFMAVSGLSGHLHYTSQAKFKIEMPLNAANSVELVPVPPATVLWSPGMPAEGVIEAASRFVR